MRPGPIGGDGVVTESTAGWRGGLSGCSAAVKPATLDSPGPVDAGVVGKGNHDPSAVGEFEVGNMTI